MKREVRTIIGFTLLVVIAAVLVSLGSRGRAPAFYDSDLKPLRTELPPSSNSFLALNAAAGRIRGITEDKLAQITRMAEGSKKWDWDQTLAEELLSRNQDVLETVTSLLAQKLQVPTPKSFDEDYSYLSDWATVALLESLRSAVLYREGHEREAFELAFEVVAFGSRIEECGGVSIHYLRGASIKMIGLRRIMRMSFKTGLSAEQLVELASRLDHLRGSEGALTNTFQTEYQVRARIIEDVAQGKSSGTNRSILPAGMPTPMFKVAETRRLVADSARLAIKSIPLKYSEVPSRDSPLFLTNSSLRTHVGSLLRGNPIGEGLYDLLRISPYDLLRRKCEENVAVSATQTVLALRAYLSQHGDLPRSLPDLVPTELSALPLDDFDGKALRYSREKRILYSVGWNTTDDGGVERNANNERLDIVFKLEF